MLRRMLSLVLGALLTWCGAALSAADRPPNVLFLIADDLNNSLGCYGHKICQTPNLDKLAARGARFDRAYCQFPLCGPSRNCLLTGLYPNSTGIIANAQIFRQTIPTQYSLSQAFRLQDYLAVRIGKLYHYNVPRSIGTNGHDDPGSWEIEINPAGVDRLEEEDQIFTLKQGEFGGTLSWYASPAKEVQHTDAIQASEAEWVLERCAKQPERPFFLAVGFFRPHTPYVSPKQYHEMYDRAKMPVVTGVKEDQADIPKPGLGSYKKEQDQLTEELTRECLQAYFASVSFMDAQVGKVLATLDRLGLSDNTIVVFTSDHGYHLGEHGLWQKMSLFEESARVPLLMAGPGITPKSVIPAPVGLVDVMPTLTEMCRVKTQANVQGQSLVPMLKDPSNLGRGWTLTQVARGGGLNRPTISLDVGSQGNQFMGYSLRTPRYRYTEWDEGRQGRELYDHEHDPKELKNLAESPEHATTVKDLSVKLQAAVKTTFPADGKRPEVKPGLWAPNLTNP